MDGYSTRPAAACGGLRCFLLADFAGIVGAASSVACPFNPTPPPETVPAELSTPTDTPYPTASANVPGMATKAAVSAIVVSLMAVFVFGGCDGNRYPCCFPRISPMTVFGPMAIGPAYICCCAVLR
jgi:hypothetical protein